MEAMGNATYKHDDYQCQIAADVVMSKSNILVALMGPGQGKTFVMLLSAYYKVHVEGVPLVYICSSDPLVVE